MARLSPLAFRRVLRTARLVAAAYNLLRIAKLVPA